MAETESNIEQKRTSAEGHNRCNAEEYMTDRYTCHRCGYVWVSRTGKPHKCPRCQSTRWNDQHYRFVCYRCGHSWSSRTGNGSADIKMCPKCKSRKWNEVIGMSVCLSCGCKIKYSRNTRFCNKCMGKDYFEMHCSFCGTDWISSEENYSVCPMCGALHNKGRLPDDCMIWSCGRTVLRHVALPDVSVIYLWIDDIPVACCYMHEISRITGYTEDELISKFGDPSFDKLWSVVSSSMYARREDYKHDINYYVKTLDLSDSDAEILALHSTGMSPEAIAMHYGVTQEDIRLSFDRIMESYKKKGIVVDDTVYTEDPKTYY